MSNGLSGYGAASGSYMAARNNASGSNYSTGGGAREYQHRLRQRRIEEQGRYNRAVENGEIAPFNVNTPFYMPSKQPTRRTVAQTSRVTPIEPEADKQRRPEREEQARAQQEKINAQRERERQAAIRKKQFNDAFIKARNSGQMYFKFSDGKVYNTALSKNDQDWLKLNDNSSDFKMNINPLKVVNVKTIAGQTGQPYLPVSEDEQIYEA